MFWLDRDVVVDVDNEFENEADLLSMVVDYDMDWAALKSISAWGQSDGSVTYDIDRSQLDVMSYLDASSDGEITALDALLVINGLNEADSAGEAITAPQGNGGWAAAADTAIADLDDDDDDELLAILSHDHQLLRGAN